MSMLPAGQRLSHYLPDLDDLLHDPAAYLTHTPVRIGPRRMYGLAAIFALPGIALLAACAVLGVGDGERLALGVGLLLGAAVWLMWSLRLRGHWLVLQREGVEFHYRDTSVWCPWAIFNVAGSPYVPDADSPHVGLTLPVAAEALPFLELRRQETPIAHGTEVKAPQFRLSAVDEVVLPARYEVNAADLGELLLQLGSRLGGELPRGAPPLEAYALERLTEKPLVVDAAGWITVSLTQLHLPPFCCACDEPTRATMPLHVEARATWLFDFLARTSQPLELPIPVCAACQEEIRQRTQQGGWLGLRWGGLLSLLAAVLFTTSQGPRGRESMVVVSLGAVAVGGLLGFLLGTYRAYRLPVQLSHYSPTHGTVTLRFRNPDYTERIQKQRMKDEG